MSLDAFWCVLIHHDCKTSHEQEQSHLGMMIVMMILGCLYAIMAMISIIMLGALYKETCRQKRRAAAKFPPPGVTTPLTTAAAAATTTTTTTTKTATGRPQTPPLGAGAGAGAARGRARSVSDYGRSYFSDITNSSNAAFNNNNNNANIIERPQQPRLLAQTYHVHRHHTNTQNRSRKLFLFLIAISSTLRSVSFFLLGIAHHLASDNIFQYRVPSLILDSLPGVMFVSVEILLIIFWAQIYHYSKADEAHAMPNFQRTFIIANVVIYLVLFVLYAVNIVFYWKLREKDAATQKFLPVEKATVIYGALLFYICAAGFLIYGGNLFRKLRNLPIMSSKRKSYLRKVGAVTLVCTVCFTTRASLMIAEVIYQPLGYSWLFNLGYYVFLELVPLMLLLVVLHSMRVSAGTGGGGGGGGAAAAHLRRSSIMADPNNNYYYYGKAGGSSSTRGSLNMDGRRRSSSFGFASTYPFGSGGGAGAGAGAGAEGNNNNNNNSNVVPSPRYFAQPVFNPNPNPSPNNNNNNNRGPPHSSTTNYYHNYSSSTSPNIVQQYTYYKRPSYH